MLSLKDEIKRFENMVYNKQLAEFVTVDQMFVGGGITIQSMIHESNFIVQELKKMNEVFLNYCKLNQKVYNKIIEHQLNLHNQQGRLNILTNSIDRKIDDMAKNVKQLHDSTLQQNQKSLKMIESVTLPLKRELQKKIDKITFEVQMKQILQDEDQQPFNNNATQEGGAQDKLSTGSNQGGGLPGLNPDGTPIVRKKGKVGYEEFYRLQAQISNRMKASDFKLQNTSNQATEGKQLIIKYIPTINKNVFDLNTHSSQIYKLNHDIDQQRNHLASAINKLHVEITSKTNDQAWKNKLDNYYEKELKPIFNVIEEDIKSGQRQFKVYKQTNNIKFSYIDEDFKDMKNRMGTAENLLKKHSKEINKITEQVKFNHEEFYQQKVTNEKNMENLRYQTTKKFQTLQKSVSTQIEQLKRLINNLAQSIQESVLKAVVKKMQAQLKLIENDIRTNRQNTRNIKTDVHLICQQIKNVKDILSKKANFADIIHQVQKKADKQDFIQLQSKMNQTSQQFISKNLNQSISISRAERQRERQRSKDKEKPQKVRASSLSRANKTLFAPRSATNRMNKTDLDTSTKLFMCGLEGQFGQKYILNPNSRRKSIKSSAAVISDFIL